MATKQNIQHGPSPATITQVALTAWEALDRWPADRVRRDRRPPAGQPPLVQDLADMFLRYVARAYQRTGLPPPEGVDDLEAIGEEAEQRGWEAAAAAGAAFTTTQAARFWQMARTHHEAIAWLQSPEGREAFWIDAHAHPPRDGQAVIYYFHIVGPHLGWHSHNASGGEWSGHQGFLGNEVTHWIPLPGPGHL